MSEIKTKATTQSATDFLNALESEEKKKDSFVILEMMQKITGEKPVMWGTSIVGFGKYHYKSERSKQEGDWPLVGFSPRKQNLSLYIKSGAPDEDALLEKLGKHTAGVGCVYVKRLADVDHDILSSFIKTCYEHMKKIHK